MKKNTLLAKMMGARGFTYVELSMASGVCKATIARLLKGHSCHSRTAMKLAAALACEPEAIGFFLDEVEQNRNNSGAGDGTST